MIRIRSQIRYIADGKPIGGGNSTDSLRKVLKDYGELKNIYSSNEAKVRLENLGYKISLDKLNCYSIEKLKVRISKKILADAELEIPEDQLYKDFLKNLPKKID